VLALDAWGDFDRGPADPLRRGVTHGAVRVARNLLFYWGPSATLVSHPVAGQPALLGFIGRELAGVLVFTMQGGGSQGGRSPGSQQGGGSQGGRPPGSQQGGGSQGGRPPGSQQGGGSEGGRPPGSRQGGGSQGGRPPGSRQGGGSQGGRPPGSRHDKIQAVHVIADPRQLAFLSAQFG
jgi:hypothetical protein